MKTDAMFDKTRIRLNAGRSSDFRPFAGQSRRAKVKRPLTVSRFAVFSLIVLALALSGCQGRDKSAARAQPVIKFTKVPIAGPDDPAKTSEISGRVIDAEPGLRVVLYSKGVAAWWVQPFANQPFTQIRSDSTWVSWT